jgi:hypothetical protein
MSEMINIPAKIENGQVVLRLKKPVSIIDEGTHINISVPILRLMTKEKIIHRRSKIKLFPVDEVLLVNIDNQINLDKEKDYISSIEHKYGFEFIYKIKYKNSNFVEIITQDDLYLYLNGSSKARLSKCHIYIPFLKKTAISVNHAYTLISTHFEKYRKSHTGNIFTKVLAKSKNQRWYFLEHFRDTMIRKEFSNNSDSTNPLSDI